MKWKFLYIDPRRIKAHSVNLGKAFKYAKMMEKGDKFPPVKVHLDRQGVVICQDGTHRTSASVMCNMNVFVKTKANL